MAGTLPSQITDQQTTLDEGYWYTDVGGTSVGPAAPVKSGGYIRGSGILISRSLAASQRWGTVVMAPDGFTGANTYNSLLYLLGHPGLILRDLTFWGVSP